MKVVLHRKNPDGGRSIEHEIESESPFISALRPIRASELTPKAAAGTWCLAVAQTAEKPSRMVRLTG